MNEDKSPIDRRISIRARIGSSPGDPEGLRNIITNKYPDGALAFVNENRALYELDKESTATADNLNIVEPVGGPGRWLLLSQGASAEGLVAIVGTAENVVPSIATPDFVGVSTNFFDWQPTGAPAGYTLTALGGIVNYVGSAIVEARVRLDLSVYFPGGVGGGGGGALAPGAVDLGTAGNYTILAKTGITNVPTSAITGNMGVSPITHTAITGFALVLDGSGQFSTSAQVTGQVFAADYSPPTPAILTQAVLDMQAAYTDAAGRVADFTNVGGGAIGGMTLTPGVYKWTTGVGIATNLTLSGGPNAVFIFQIAGVLSIAAATSVLLTGGVVPENIFWQVSSNASFGATSHFEGVVLTLTNISLVAGATANGRLLAQTAVNLDSNTVSAPAAVSSGTVWAAVDLNGDVIGTDPTTSFQPGTQVTEAGGPTAPESISTERSLLLHPGDQIRMALATDVGANLALERGTLSITLH